MKRDHARMQGLTTEVVSLVDSGQITALVPVDCSKKHWLLPFPKHFALKAEPQGIYIGWDSNGVQIQNEKEFAASRVFVTHRSARKMTEEIAGRLVHNLLKPPKYDGVNSNCETVVSYILNGQAKSDQVSVVGLFALICLFFLAAT
ncbi:MAG: hypothetical protein ACRD4Q_12780 [Candidatus Acidiferrales bacterium]